MPPRKSIDLSKAGTTADEATPAKESQAAAAAGRDGGVNIEDLNLPKSIVTRLAKGVLPANTQIQGNAMLAMTKSATIFVNYLATHANENTQRANRKTIAPQDVLQALDDLEFPDFKPRLEAELARFIELQADKRNTYRKKVAADKASGKTGTGSPPPGGEEGSYIDGEGEGEGEGQMDRDGRPAAKRARMDGVAREGEGREEQDEEEEGENEEAGEDPEDDEEEDEQDHEQEREHQQEAEEQAEEAEEMELEDEALDNGEDSE